MPKTANDRFTNEHIAEELRQHPGWTYDAGNITIERTFDCKNFLGCASFIQKIAEEAERQDHHPDLLLSGYKNVKVMLTTHSAKGVTQNDFDMAQAIDKLAA